MIPAEVAVFLREPGRSLVVKGAAGAGKTLFAVAAARWFQLEVGDVVWMNARDAEPAVVEELDDFVAPDARIDASRPLAAAADAEPASPMAILEDLRGELDAEARVLVVVDSVSALTADAPPREVAAFERGLTGLARERGANMLLILESSASEPIEYLADGVVALGEEETPAGRVRVLRSQKLRGAPAALARHPFTLADGAFWTPAPGGPQPPEMATRAPARTDEAGRVSTGTHAWDLLLAGGFARGSVCLVEAPAAVGSLEDALVVPFVLNARVLGRDVAAVLSSGASRASFERWILPHLPPGARGALTLVEAGELVEEPRFGDKAATLDERLTRIERARARAAPPVASVLNVDALAAAAPREDVERWLSRWAFVTRERGHVDVLVARPDHARLAASVADSHWKLDAWEGHLVARGLTPRTEPLFAQLRTSRGFPETELLRVQ